MPREQIPITPEVLRWARQRAHYSVEEIRLKFPKIEDWEAGKEFPTYPQLENISKKFKVPVAVFFFPEPPNIPPIRESFRTLPDVDFDQLPREIHFLLRKAKVLQINLSELNDNHNPATRFILNDLRFQVDINIPAMAQSVRNYLKITLGTQINWKNNDIAFDNWRSVLQGHGITVFKDAFKNDSYSGFCLYDEAFPIIYINNSAKTRQIFTLFHELAHLLFQTSGVDLVDDNLERYPIHDERIEAICNQFAAEFLLPDARLKKEFANRKPTEETAEHFANRYHISREMVFRRFLNWNLISVEEYLAASRKWANQYLKSRKRDGENIANPYWTKIAYLGTNYVRLAFSKFHQNHITEEELSDYLDTKVKNLTKLEDHYLQKMV